MTCKIACKCGKLKGTAFVTTPHKDLRVYRPMLAYRNIVGSFTIVGKDYLIVCNECGEPAMTVGDWE
jgi:hypothetical protein